MTTIYRATQRDTTECTAWVDVDGRRRALPEVRTVRTGRVMRGSNGGFSYGYRGTGPHNLARAIVAHALGLPSLNAREDRATLVNDLVDAKIAPHPQHEPFAIDRDELVAWIDARNRLWRRRAEWRRVRALAERHGCAPSTRDPEPRALDDVEASIARMLACVDGVRGHYHLPPATAP